MDTSGSSKKRLLFVISSLGGGGAERVMVNLINHYNKVKYDILLVTFEDKTDCKEFLCPSAKIVCLNKKNRWDFFKLIFGLRNIVRSYKPVSIISFLYYTNIVVALSTLIMKKKFRLILCERNYHRKYLSKTRLSYLKQRLLEYAYKKADIIIAVSRGIEKAIREDFNITSRKIRTIYNPVFLEEIKVRSGEGVNHRFFRDKKQVIISVGSLTGQKRFDRLLKAFSLIRSKAKDVYLIILGKGPLRRDLEALAGHLGIGGYVDFVGFKPNPYAWISKADIFVLSSDWEGCPNVLLEAMACGVPVIATDCDSGPGELITNGKDGILVSMNAETDLAEAIAGLLRNFVLREKFSMEAGKRIEDFKLDKIALQYEESF